MISLSTAWNAERWLHGADIAAEISSLGFRNLECNFSLTRDMVEGVTRYARAHQLGITSLHNYCPIPPELKREEALPDCFSLSSLDKEERKKAVHYTKITIRTAAEVGAKAVVLHAGRVEIPDHTRELIKLANQGLKGTSQFIAVFDAFVAERAAKCQDYFASLLDSLDELADYAQESSVALGIENRFYYREIPFGDEFAVIFDRFKDRPVGYWHDVGHSFIFEQLGFIPDNALLDRYGEKLIGLHLHNVKDLVDHQAPADGDYDMRRLVPYVKEDTIKVIEAHDRATPEAIKRSAEFLEGLFHD